MPATALAVAGICFPDGKISRSQSYLCWRRVQEEAEDVYRIKQDTSQSYLCWRRVQEG